MTTVIVRCTETFWSPCIFNWFLNTTGLSHLEIRIWTAAPGTVLVPYPACFKTTRYSQYCMWVSGARFSHCFSPFRLIGPFTGTETVWPSVVQVLRFSIHIPLMNGLCDCYTVYVREISGTFQQARWKIFRRIFETSETTNPATRCHTPEDVNPRYVCIVFWS